MKRAKLHIYVLSLLFAMILMLTGQLSLADESKGHVYFIPVEQEVERGLEAFLNRSINQAIEEGADHVVFEVNTPGGLVNAAGNIAKLIRETELPTTAFITKDALSAGAYIALNANQIVMTPGSRMGAAAVIDQEGNTAEDKAVSAWLADMQASAELNDRDPLYALAMADASIDLPEYDAGEGKLLTLTSNQALEVGYAEGIAENRTELLEFLNLSGARISEGEVTIAERIARFVTHPVIVPLLLTIGSLGLVLELYSPGFGIPGIMGASALFLFFFGHAIAGFAGWEAFLLLAAGLILLIIEIVTPGFGIFGVSGMVAVIISILMSTGTSMVNGLLYLFIAFIVTLAVSVFYIRFFGYRGFLNKLVLTDSTSREKGYIASVIEDDLIDQIGTTVTPLRPSGILELGDKRLDVISEGGYIENGKKVKIVKSEGTRIIVREVK